MNNQKSNEKMKKIDEAIERAESLIVKMEKSATLARELLVALKLGKGEKLEKSIMTSRGWWIEQLLPIIDEYKDGSTEPLDGDEVYNLCHIIKAKINLQEGNITQKEYDDILG